jgi:hypothetical protein
MGKICKGGMPVSGYTKLPNELIRNQNIGDGTFRFIAWIQSHADGFSVSFASIKAGLGYGREKLRTIIKEAEENGYLLRLKIKDSHGRYDWDYYVFADKEECSLFKATHPGVVYPPVDEPPTGKPGVGKPPVDDRVYGSSVGGCDPPHKKNINSEDKKEEEKEKEARDCDGFKSNSTDINNLSDKRTDVSNSPITQSKDGYSAAALQNAYAQAANVYELIDAFLLSPDTSDTAPPSEMLGIFRDRAKWQGWVLPWRSKQMSAQFQNCNPEIVKKLAIDLARKDKSTPEQKYGHAIAIINQWERTKGGWVNLMNLCDRPSCTLPSPDLSKASEELSEIPQYLKDWYEIQHEYHHRTQYLKSRSLEEFFAGKDNRAWYRYAKEKFPTWEWSK